MAVETRPGLTANRIESLLSARLFLEPQLADGRIYFISNLSGHMSLYAMDEAGGVPEPLLPPQLALQNPELVDGLSFAVLPELDRIVVMIDSDGDENYEPYVAPLAGGFPEPFAPDTFAHHRSHLVEFDRESGIAYFAAESREESVMIAFRVDLATGDADELGRSMYGGVPAAWTPDHSRIVLADGYTLGDVILYEPDGNGGKRVLYGTPIEEREPGREYPLTGFGIESAHGLESGEGILLTTTVFDDAGTPAYLAFDRPGELEPVAVEGLVH